MSKAPCNKCHRRIAKKNGKCAKCYAGTPNHSDAEYRRNRKIVMAEETHCWQCGEPVLSGEKASVDHVVPLRHGGSHARSNLRLAHLGCNQMRNNHGTAKKRQKRHTLPGSSSGQKRPGVKLSWTLPD